MRLAHNLATSALLSLMIPIALSAPSRADSVVWRELPDLPRAVGGQFVGTIGDTLVVAGGSYFDVPPWDAGKKTWVDDIYTLERGATEWKSAGHLPTKLGYGGSISTEDGMLIVGGQNGSGSTPDTLRLTRQDGRIQVSKMAMLPHALTMFAAVPFNGEVYVAGGQLQPSSTQSMRGFRVLSAGEWHEIESWPGPSRILPLMAELEGFVYVISGAELTGSPGPPVGRRFLRDAYRYNPRTGWQKLPNLPNAVQAGTAIAWQGRILVFSGNDGVLAEREFELKDKHPGFRKEVLAFDPVTGSWAKIGEMPYSLVTTGITRWGDEWVIAGGEARPAHRSAKVIAGHLR